MTMCEIFSTYLDSGWLLEEGTRLLHVVGHVLGQATHDVLVDQHPRGNGCEASSQNSQARLLFGDGKSQQHHREEAEEKLGERLLDRRTGGDREHADVVVDGVHLMDAIEAHRPLVDVLLRIGNRVEAFILVTEILFDDLSGHARALGGGLTTVINAIEMEMDADTVRERIDGIVRRRQRNPPDRREIGSNDHRQRKETEPGNHQVLFVGSCGHCLVLVCVGREPCTRASWAAEIAYSIWLSSNTAWGVKPAIFDGGL
jgi:hypothetical protein